MLNTCSQRTMLQLSSNLVVLTLAMKNCFISLDALVLLQFDKDNPPSASALTKAAQDSVIILDAAGLVRGEAGEIVWRMKLEE